MKGQRNQTLIATDHRFGAVGVQNLPPRRVFDQGHPGRNEAANDSLHDGGAHQAFEHSGPP